MSSIRYFMQFDRKGSSTPYGNNKEVGHYVMANDAKLYYEVYGEGKPLLVLHGGGLGSPYELGEFIDKFRCEYKVIVLLIRGHGKSEMGTTPLTYEQRATDIIAVLDEITKDPVAVFGFSDGAYSAYKLAEMYPERVERIVSVGAGIVKKGDFASDIRVEDLEKADEKYINQLRMLSPQPERLQEFFTKYMQFWHSMEIGSELFSSIKCPVLLIVGDEDDHAPVETVMKAFELIPNSRVCVVPKAWHTAFLDNFEITWNATSQFLKTDINDLKPSKKVTVETNSKELKKDVLLETSKSWDGCDLPDYPIGKPEFKIVKYSFPPKAILSKHHHMFMSGGYILKGELTLIKEDGTEKAIREGEAFMETVKSIHYGENRLDIPLITVNFYVSQKDQPLSVQD
jgi:pimeloyl-ACP methyl ester carboxylesterase/quercetin dioxygenase-like cupin family protein